MDVPASYGASSPNTGHSASTAANNSQTNEGKNLAENQRDKCVFSLCSVGHKINIIKAFESSVQENRKKNLHYCLALAKQFHPAHKNKLFTCRYAVGKQKTCS